MEISKPEITSNELNQSPCKKIQNRAGEDSQNYQKAIEAWEDADTETAYELFNSVLDEYPENSMANLLAAICGNVESYFDDEILADVFCTYYPEISDDKGIILSYLCSLFDETIIELVEKSKKAYTGKLSHKDLIDFVRSTDGAARIFETAVAVLESRGNTKTSEYKDCLKYLFLLYPIMQTPVFCSECGGYCKSSEWKHAEDCAEKFQATKEKLDSMNENFTYKKHKADKEKVKMMKKKLIRKTVHLKTEKAFPKRKSKHINLF